MKILLPLMTYSSPSLTATVLAPATSEPASGSVKPKQPILLPSASGRSHFSFCSGVANSSMLDAHKDVCTDTVILVLASTFESSSIKRT